MIKVIGTLKTSKERLPMILKPKDILVLSS